MTVMAPRSDDGHPSWLTDSLAIPAARLPFHARRAGIIGRWRWCLPDKAVLSRNATPSVLHQCHIGRVLMEPFARTIDAAKKYVVSRTLERVDWNAELVRGDLGKAVQQLKQESGKGLFVAGTKLAQALAELGLIDEYEFVVHPRLAGHGPTLFAGLSKHVDLRLVNRREFGSGAVAMRYVPRR